MDDAPRGRELHIIHAECPSEMSIVKEWLDEVQEAGHDRECGIWSVCVYRITMQDANV